MINYNDVEISDLLLVKINEYYYFGMVHVKKDNRLILSNVIYGVNETYILDKLILYRYDLEKKSSSIKVKGRLKPGNLDYDYAFRNMKIQNIHMIFPELFI